MSEKPTEHSGGRYLAKLTCRRDHLETKLPDLFKILSYGSRPVGER
jgi:hypothetical protein